MIIIGLTGGIGTGKSTVSNYLKEHNCLILDADAISRQMTEKGQPALIDIAKAFGEDCHYWAYHLYHGGYHLAYTEWQLDTMTEDFKEIFGEDYQTKIYITEHATWPNNNNFKVNIFIYTLQNDYLKKSVHNQIRLNILVSMPILG
jgi:hypothetical protein